VAVAALVLFAAAALTVPGWAGEYWTRVFTGVAMWAGLALSWNVIGGYAGYISFGQVAFFGIGSYTTAILMQPEHGWNFFLTLPVGAALAVLLAVVVGWPALRLRGAYFAIATWALAEAMLQVANAVGFTGGSSGLSITAVATDTFFYYMMLGTAVVAYAVCYLLLERGRFGYKVKAVRDNENAARSVGIDTTRVKLQAFALSAVIPAVFGGINAYWITFINPQSVLAGVITDQMVVMALVGGLGHIWGSAIGATVLYVLNQEFVNYFGDSTAYIAMVGIVVALVVLFLPDGVVGLLPRARRRRVVRMLIRRLPGGERE